MKIEEVQGKLTVVDFDQLQAYKISCKVEKDGIEFYQKLIDNSNDETFKPVINLLIEEEKKHLEFFSAGLARMRKEQEDNFGEDDLLNFIDYGVYQPYQSMENLADEIKDVKKALSLAVIIEEKSVQFYQACMGEVSARKTKIELQRIIDEEEQHKKLFTGLLTKIK